MDKAEAVARGESERQTISEGRAFLDELTGAASREGTE
jgi:hypothetical protein